MTLKLLRASRIVAFAGLFGSAAVANAGHILLPDLAYTSSTTLIPITIPDFGTLTTLSDPNLTVTFSTLMEAFTVPTTWTNWNSPPAVESSTPRVLSPFDFTLTSITLTFSRPLSIFGLEAEPDALSQYGAFPVSETFYNGATQVDTISRTIDGSSAALFAASSTTPFTSVVLAIGGNAAVPNGTDPGIAQVRYALATPEPATGIAFGAGLAVLIGLRRFRTIRS